MGLLSSIKSKMGKSKNSAPLTDTSGYDTDWEPLDGRPADFLVTTELDIRSTDYDTDQAGTANTLETIRVRRVTSGQDEYVSTRKKTDSDDLRTLCRESDQDRTLISTSYHSWPPEMHILPNDVRVPADERENVIIRGGQFLDTPWGKFGWYGDGHWNPEKEDGDNTSLVMHCLDNHDFNNAPYIARLSQNANLQKPGTLKQSQGNCGRLELDLRKWKKEDKAAAEQFILASCILELEVEASIPFKTPSC